MESRSRGHRRSHDPWAQTEMRRRMDGPAPDRKGHTAVAAAISVTGANRPVSPPKHVHACGVMRSPHGEHARQKMNRLGRHR